MGAGCICHNIKNHFSNKADFEINKPNYNVNLQKKNDQSSLNKNNISTLTNKKGNEKKNMLFNEIVGNSSENSVGSGNSEKKDNDIIPLNYQINNDLINNQINNEISCKNNSPSQKNSRGRRTSFLNGVESVESATPKVTLDKVKLEEKTKGKKKAFSNFCQNKQNENH